MTMAKKKKRQIRFTKTTQEAKDQPIYFFHGLNNFVVIPSSVIMGVACITTILHIIIL